MNRSKTPPSESKSPRQRLPHHPLKLRILLIADLDLQSAARLSEFALRDPGFFRNNDNEINDHDGPESGHRNQESRDVTDVDLCIAVGPFLHGSQSVDENVGVEDDGERLFDEDSGGSRERYAAEEGSMTGALSQLENIVCRVVFVPGHGDPPSTLGIPPITSAMIEGLSTEVPSSILSGRVMEDHPHKRLTPNSRNLHRRSLQMAPDLVCAGYCQHSSLSSEKCRMYPRSEIALGDDSMDVSGSIDKLMSLSSPSDRAILITHLMSQKPTTTRINLKEPQREDWNTNDTMPSSRTNEYWPESWPSTFLNSHQDKVILNIANSTGQEAFKADHGRIKVVCPGSLRQRGEFAFVDLEFCEEDKKIGTDRTKMQQCGVAHLMKHDAYYAWRVGRIYLRSMYD